MSFVPTQAMLNQSHAALDLLIERTREAAIWACNANKLDLRDTLYEGLGDLYKVKARFGQLDFGGGITTASGGK